MPRLSSQLTFLYKRVLPVVRFEFLVLFATGAAVNKLASGRLPPFPLLMVIVAMGVISFSGKKKLIFDLVDEVLDAGDALVVRNEGQEHLIPLADISNVN
jgi:hypothetical protein